MNESHKDNLFYHFVANDKSFSKKWIAKKVENEFIIKVLSKASKSLTDERGEPDFIYLNEDIRLLILLENKDNTEQHENKENNKNDIQKYATSGLKHYLSFFVNFTDENLKQYFKTWKIVGIALSGNIEMHHNHKITSFAIKSGKIENINKNEILNEDEYINLFENYDIELITKEISQSSKKINNLLRSTDSQNRPVLLSALMICLYDKNSDFYQNFINFKPATIINNISITIQTALEKEQIPITKINIFLNQLSFIKTIDLEDEKLNILRNILLELKNNVIPLFNTKTNYDIIGKFYEEFLKYAGIANVKKGIVLTPHHITQLFTELIDLKTNDIIFDPCCGTGAFLIAGMNAIINKIQKSEQNNKTDLIKKVKENQLIGIEKNPTMYSLALSNMLFRGDGKSKIYNDDFFSFDINAITPTIGFINPPYSGKDNADNPTKKEIQFLFRLLNVCSRYVVIIAPLSTYFKEDELRNQILAHHTLKCVINMPQDLFQPNASTHTAIAVFETHTPHENKEVIFYNLEDDGFVLAKSKGRTDVYNKWGKIKEDFLKKIKEPEKYADNITLVKKSIEKNDEWIIQAHSKTDYSNLSEKDFLDSIKEYVIFSTKKDLGLLDEKMNEIDLLEVLNGNNIKFNND